MRRTKMVPFLAYPVVKTVLLV